MFAFDIETGPNENLVDALPEPEVKYGNIKNDDLKKEKYNAAKQNQVERMALDPLYGRMLSFAVWHNDDQYYRVIDDLSDASEIVLIKAALSLFTFNQTAQPTIVTWDGYRFDIPFLFYRAMCLNIDLSGINVLGLSHWCKRYSRIPHCDLRLEFTGWDFNKYIKLNTASKIILGESKIDHDVTTNNDLIKNNEKEKVGIYNLHDAELTYKLYKKAYNYLF
jgi:predicted PolB exonuclease-like 3'-5' exonuclease